jgi:L-lysine exporter family protein LysE/ArgO
MLHLIFVGLLLGLGAAIPIGPINLEIIRRNLRFGTSAGLCLGLGACCADVTYLALLSLGVLQLLNHPLVLKLTGIVGSCILGWFGYQALRLKARHVSDTAPHAEKIKSNKRHFLDGYFLTLINPFTILFWSSISATIAVIATSHLSVFYTGFGVLFGAFSWDMSLNFFLHFTRHRLPKSAVQKINAAGGLILICFAVAGLLHAL